MMFESQDRWSPEEDDEFRGEMLALCFGMVGRLPVTMASLAASRASDAARSIAADVARRLDESGALTIELTELVGEIAGNGGYCHRNSAVDVERPPPPDPVTVRSSDPRHRLLRVALGAVSIVPTTILRAVVRRIS